MGCSGSKEVRAGPNSPGRLRRSVYESQQDLLGGGNEHSSHSAHLSQEMIELQLQQQFEHQLEVKMKQVRAHSISPPPESLEADTADIDTCCDTVELTLGNSGTSTDTNCTSVENIAVTLSPQEVLERKENKRVARITNLRAELLSTEQRYVSNLTTAMEVIMLPLIKDNLMESDIAADQFNDFIAIAKFNRIMLDEFEAHPEELIAVLRKYTPGLRLYTSYLQHFERRMHARAKLINNNALHAFYERAREQHQSSLESFLVEPVQRIPRYKMLLSELHAHMLPGDPEYEVVGLAMAEVANMALYNNEAIREMEKRMEENAIMMQVVTLTRINVLDDPSRCLLKTSFNLKCTSFGCIMKPLQIWLFNDKIVYGRSGNLKKKIFKSTRYTEIPLSHCNVVSSPEDEDEDEETSTSFIFESERESFLIIAKTASERNEWFDAITAAIHARRKVSQRSRSGSIPVMAPVWKLNDASNICDICSKQFGVRLRRHHCRLCGSLICDACSPKRVVLVQAGVSHTYQRSESELERLSLPELDKLAQKEILAVKSRQDEVPRGRAGKKEKKERVCTVCYNNLSFQYVQHQAEGGGGGMRLEITLVSATDLKNMDYLSLSDPYVIFSCSNHSLKSRTIDDNLNPVWGGSTDIFCFAYQPAVAPGDLAGGAGAERRREICVEMYDEDPTYDDFLGNTVIDLNEYPQLEEGLAEQAGRLEGGAGPVVKLDLELQPPGSGRIQLELRVLLPAT